MGGNKRGRKPKYETLGYTKQEFRDLLLRLYVNENYDKVSDREVLEKLMDYGFVNENKHKNIKRPASEGTLSSWKATLELKEIDIYEFYKDKIDKTYEEWSKAFNKGNKNSYYSKLTPEKIRWKMLKHFGIPNTRQSLSELEDFIVDMYNTLGFNGRHEISCFYKELEEGLIE